MRSSKRWMYMVSLIFAGEAIYMLPYLRRSYQTSMQEVFEVTFTQLGLLNSMFGLLAVTAYFAGGWLSDRVSTRKLLSFSLFATGLGGYYMATVPSFPVLLFIHAFWGVTTILTFWAALIKATRLWGDPDDQGFTFGLLDGGRGLVGALLASSAIWVFSWYAAGDADGLIVVLIYYSTASMLAGLCALAFVPDDEAHGSLTHMEEGPAAQGQLRAVLTMPVVWLQALIILLAYWLYVGTFEFAAYAELVYGQDKVFGAKVGAFTYWVRPIAAVGAGLLADRIRPTRAVGIAFVVAGLGYFGMVVVPGDATRLALLWIQVAVTAIAVFALRGIYFALLEESKVPIVLTGTAVGVISTIGYTPDVFAYPISGWFLDTFGGGLGYAYYFSLLVAVAAAGLLLTLILAWVDHRSAYPQRETASEGT